MRIAIVGSGIAGLTAAWVLRREHEVTVFEANDYVGGHTHTVDVEYAGEHQAIDTGFIVHNDRTYPNLLQLFEQLGVETIPTSMSFSVRCDESGVEYNGTSLNGMFAQRRNLLRPRFHRMLREILRFNREAPRLLSGSDDSQTVCEYLAEHHYGREFALHYLMPMGAAIWSCPESVFMDFPIRFIAEFYHNHGLLSLTDRPEWRVVAGGSVQYVRRMLDSLGPHIRLSTPVRRVQRAAAGVRVLTDATDEVFDEVIFACHSDQALRLLEGPDSAESELLGAFPYQANSVILHTDASVLPRRRRAWASWNYRRTASHADGATVSYCMNLLQHLQSDHTWVVSLNQDSLIDPDRIVGRYRYSHPVAKTGRAALQSRHEQFIRRRRISFCGAWWGNGFHEDGVVSGLRVCRAFGLTLTGAVPSARLADRVAG